MDRVPCRKHVIAMHEQVTIKGCGVQEAPPLSKAPDVTTMPLPNALVCGATQHRLDEHGVRSVVLIRLHIELDRLSLLKWMFLELRHHPIQAKEQVSLKGC